VFSCCWVLYARLKGIVNRSLGVYGAAAFFSAAEARRNSIGATSVRHAIARVTCGVDE
jgi:hypothetical protein